MNAAGHSHRSGRNPSRRIYLLRHGAIQAPDRERRYIGQQDLPLNDEGLRQARAWSAYFAQDRPDVLYCSDLARCRETARLIGRRCALEPEPRPELREVALGEWEGETFAAVKTRDPAAFQARGKHIADHRPPAGESFRDLEQRVWPFFQTTARQGPPRSLLVTHAGVMRVLLSRLLGMPLGNLFAIGLAYGTLSIVDVRPSGYRLQALNLPAPA